MVSSIEGSRRQRVAAVRAFAVGAYLVGLHGTVVPDFLTLMEKSLSRKRNMGYDVTLMNHSVRFDDGLEP
jgi:hypothetical protein